MYPIFDVVTIVEIANRNMKLSIIYISFLKGTESWYLFLPIFSLANHEKGLKNIWHRQTVLGISSIVSFISCSLLLKKETYSRLKLNLKK